MQVQGTIQLPKKPSSLSVQVYTRLRKEILGGTFAPEEPLRLAQLKDRYGVGFSPLREALTRLSAEGLVSAEAMRGFYVAPLSLADLYDTMETRIFVETEALRRSINRGGDDWEARIVSTLHAFKLQLGRRDKNKPESLETLEVRHRDFHFALVSASGSARLQTIVETLYVGSARYRVLRPDHESAYPIRDLAVEHSVIAEAALGRDTHQASKLLEDHYRRTAEGLELAHQGKLKATA